MNCSHRTHFQRLHGMVRYSQLVCKYLKKRILSVVMYGCKTLVITKNINQKLKVHKKATEKIILGISLKELKTNIWIRKKSKIIILKPIGFPKIAMVGYFPDRQKLINWTLAQPTLKEAVKFGNNIRTMCTQRKPMVKFDRVLHRKDRK